MESPREMMLITTQCANFGVKSVYLPLDSIHPDILRDFEKVVAFAGTEIVEEYVLEHEDSHGRAWKSTGKFNEISTELNLFEEITDHFYNRYLLEDYSESVNGKEMKLEKKYEDLLQAAIYPPNVLSHRLTIKSIHNNLKRKKTLEGKPITVTKSFYYKD